VVRKPRNVLLMGLLALSASTASAMAQKIDVGVVEAMGRAPEFIAMEKGYFRDLGLDVNFIPMDSSSRFAAANAEGSLPIIGGAVSAGFFNSVAKGFHVKLMLEGGSTPIGLNLMVRPDLQSQLHTLADLKGHSISVTSPGSSNIYVAAKMLETVGLTLRDVDAKYIGFSQLSAAFANRALDAAIVIQPTVALLESGGFAKPWIDPDDVIRPTPMLVSGMLTNTDWVTKNSDLARRYFVAIMKGVRDYCTAYHGGPNRAEVVSILTRNTVMKDPAFLDHTVWLSRSARGLIPVESLLDIQQFFYREGLVEQELPIDQLIDMSLVNAANETLGPYVPPNSTKPGCR
jgi:NitT/TauT family transport system substrate-binding protein